MPRKTGRYTLQAHHLTAGDMSISSGSPLWQYYSFHYMTANGDRVFRYDNALHYACLAFSPHHRHEGQMSESLDALSLVSAGYGTR